MDQLTAKFLAAYHLQGAIPSIFMWALHLQFYPVRYDYESV